MLDNLAKLRVVFDEQIFFLQKHGGISRYFVELIATFRSHPELGVEPLLTLRKARSEHLLDRFQDLKLVRVQSPVCALWLLVKSAISNRRRSLHADVIHFTFYTPGFFGRFRGVPKVATLFDMTPENTPRGYRFWNPHLQKRKYLTQSEGLVSISSTSTADLLKSYKASFSLPTTYLGVSSSFQPNLDRVQGQEEKYLLFVGARSGYKNWHLSALAFSEVIMSHQELKYVLAGGGKLTRSEKKLLEKLGIRHKVIQKSIPDSELPQYYSNAVALVYTSKYEGFGLPLVEAMASGIPVLASDIPVNREICESVAWYFSAEEPDALALLMGQAAQGTLPMLDRKIPRGIQRAKKFTWYSCAEKTAQVYRSLIHSQGATS